MFSTTQGTQPNLSDSGDSIASENGTTIESTFSDTWIPEPIVNPYHRQMSLTTNNRNSSFSCVECPISTNVIDGSEQKTSLLRQKTTPGYVTMFPSIITPPDIAQSIRFSTNINELSLRGNPVPYNPKREIDRSNFTLISTLGSGNFGKVFKGIASGLHYPNSKTCVAVKTTHNASNQDQVMSLVCEAKILSNLDLHLNLVNLLGSCTSNFADTGDLWLLLEYCQEGDMKSFLQEHRGEFTNNINGKNIANL